MASFFGHVLAGYTLTKATTRKPSVWLIVIASLSAFVPDADVIGYFFGIPYEHFIGHRGFTHSIVFAVLWAAFIACFFKQQRLIAFVSVFLAILSHPIFDAMTTGGLGVAFLAPFDNTRYFFDFRPIKVSPLGIKNFFSERGLQVILSESVWIGLPCLVILFVVNRIKKIYENRRATKTS